VEFDLEEGDDGELIGAFVYTSDRTEIAYEVTGRVDNGALTLTQTAVLDTEDLGERTACEGDYVLAFDDDAGALTGSYFARTPECQGYIGKATFAAF
jgi:hypothetical protein